MKCLSAIFTISAFYYSVSCSEREGYDCYGLGTELETHDQYTVQDPDQIHQQWQSEYIESIDHAMTHIQAEMPNIPWEQLEYPHQDHHGGEIATLNLLDKSHVIEDTLPWHDLSYLQLSDPAQNSLPHASPELDGLAEDRCINSPNREDFSVEEDASGSHQSAHTEARTVVGNSSQTRIKKSYRAGRGCLGTITPVVIRLVQAHLNKKQSTARRALKYALESRPEIEGLIRDSTTYRQGIDMLLQTVTEKAKAPSKRKGQLVWPKEYRF